MVTIKIASKDVSNLIQSYQNLSESIDEMISEMVRLRSELEKKGGQ